MAFMTKIKKMTVVTDEEAEQFRETAIADADCHSSESATTIVTSSTQTITIK
jgi:hypothetical protein